MVRLQERDFGRRVTALDTLLGAYSDWFLRPASVDVNRLPVDVAVIVLVKRETLTYFPPAFLLPVQWTKAVKAHSARLPLHIVSLAQRVRDFMGKEFEAWQLVALDSTYEDIACRCG